MCGCEQSTFFGSRLDSRQSPAANVRGSEVGEDDVGEDEVGDDSVGDAGDDGAVEVAEVGEPPVPLVPGPVPIVGASPPPQADRVNIAAAATPAIA